LIWKIFRFGEDTLGHFSVLTLVSHLTDGQKLPGSDYKLTLIIRKESRLNS